MTRLLNLFVLLSNAALSRLFGRHASGDRRAWMHWSSENEDRHGNAKGWPWHGRMWLHNGPRGARVEWNFWRWACGVHLDFDPSERSVSIGLQFPPVSLWFTVSGVGSDRFWLAVTGKESRWYERSIALSVHDSSVWWNLWTNPNEWRSSTPRWREGCWHVLDTLLGKTKYSSETLSTHTVKIPMPEGAYPASVVLNLDTWKRPRWFAKRLHRANIEVPKGIPHAGKGENSWDYGEDATFGLGTTARTVDEAIGEMTACVLRSRRRYDGDVMAVYPAPSVDSIPATA